MKVEELWKQYKQDNPACKAETYEAWCYGSDMPDLLLQLTMDGRKTATASAYQFYEYEKCELPKEGYQHLK